MGLEDFEDGARPEPEKWLCPKCGRKNEFHSEVLRICRKHKSRMRCQHCEKGSSFRAWENAKGAEQDELPVEDVERDKAEDRDDEDV